MDNDKAKNKEGEENPKSNSNWQGVDKAPGEERGKKEQVTKDDLKAKKIDGDPSKETDRPE